MPGPADEKVNFEGLTILLLEQSVHGLDILVQMLAGFGARNCLRATTIAEAQNSVERTTVDLVIVDPNLREGDGLEFVRWLRNLEASNRTAPVIVASANGKKSAVFASRDAGANFFVVKPLTPGVLMDRILRVSREKRSFIISDAYRGPDRRFKMEGPPPGSAPRRSTDITTKLGDASEPNLSQDELNSMFKPQKISL